MNPIASGPFESTGWGGTMQLPPSPLTPWIQGQVNPWAQQHGLGNLPSLPSIPPIGEILAGAAAVGGLLIGLWMMAGSPAPKAVPVPV